MIDEIKCHITGRVQFVMYRDFAQRSAKGLGVCGTAENLADGSVEVIAQGAPDALKQFIERLHEGSILSRVDGVAVEWRTGKEIMDDFRIIYR